MAGQLQNARQDKKRTRQGDPKSAYFLISKIVYDQGTSSPAHLFAERRAKKRLFFKSCFGEKVDRYRLLDVKKMTDRFGDLYMN